MISVSKDLSRDPNQKSDYSVLDGVITIHDFNDKLRQLLPNFHKSVILSRNTSVGESLTILHKLTFMSGEPFDTSANIHDSDLPEYLHSLLLAIDSHRNRIEEIYAPI